MSGGRTGRLALLAGVMAAASLAPAATAHAAASCPAPNTAPVGGVGTLPPPPVPMPANQLVAELVSHLLQAGAERAGLSAVWGGAGVDPADPSRAVAHVVGDPEILGPQLRAQVPYGDFDVVRGDYTVTQLEAAGNALFQRSRELDGQGVHVAAGHVDGASNRYRVRYSSARGDAAAVLAGIGGSGLAYEYLGAPWTEVSCGRVASVTGRRKGRRFVAHWTGGAAERATLVIRRGPRAVKLGVRVSRVVDGRAVPAVACHRKAVFTLRRPLGRRRLAQLAGGGSIAVVRPGAGRRLAGRAATGVCG